jgi:hypothetical protein
VGTFQAAHSKKQTKKLKAHSQLLPEQFVGDADGFGPVNVGVHAAIEAGLDATVVGIDVVSDA